MPKNEAEIGRSALAAALARAGKRASTAAVIAAAIPLSMMAATPAQAVNICLGSNICGNGSNVTPGTGGVSNYNYSFVAGPTAGAVHSFEIPEIHAGEFLTGSGGGFLGSIPSGWFVTESLTGTAPFKAPFANVTPLAWIDVTFGGEGFFFGSGQVFNMTLESLNGHNIAATVVGSFAEGGAWEVDPPTPGPILPTPEPASLALLGVAAVGLGAVRRRRKS